MVNNYIACNKKGIYDHFGGVSFSTWIGKRRIQSLCLEGRQLENQEGFSQKVS